MESSHNDNKLSTDNHTTLKTDKPICRDYLKGHCTRDRCKFSHAPIVLARQLPITNSAPPGPIPFLSTFYIPTKGHVLLNITNLSRQMQYNGLFICNLSDIIPVEFIASLTNQGLTSPIVNGIANYQYQYIGNMINTEASKSGWHTSIRQILNWSTTSTPNFDKTNYSVVFMYDISIIVRQWVLKASRKKITNTEITSALLYYLNAVMTWLLSNMSKDDITRINIIVNYMDDELGLRNRGGLDFLYSMITSSPCKYISNHFNSNIYYLGNQPDFSKKMGNECNKGFMFCYITGSKYINLQQVLDTDNACQITCHGDSQIGDSIITYNSVLQMHNSRIYNILFEKQDQLKLALINAIPVSNIRSKNLIIIGANLDVEFDKYIITGLKATIGGIDFTSIADGSMKKQCESKPGRSNNNIDMIKKNTAPISCCGGSDDTPSTATSMSFIMPIYSQNSSVGQNPSPIQINDMLQEFLSGMKSEQLKFITSKIIQNQICTIGLNLLTTYDGKQSTKQPFETIPGIEKIKEYGQNPQNKIILVCSPKLTHDFFKEFINQITRTPGYPVKISANFIEYDINPSLRSCLGFHNYRVLTQNYLKNPFTGEVPVNQISKLAVRYMNFIEVINPEYQKHTNQPLQPKLPLPTSDKTDCCNCCNCLSRNGIGYCKFGNFPYIPIDTLNEIKDDSWLPRF